jgi:hypothetical protein
VHTRRLTPPSGKCSFAALSKSELLTLLFLVAFISVFSLLEALRLARRNCPSHLSVDEFQTKVWKSTVSQDDLEKANGWIRADPTFFPGLQCGGVVVAGMDAPMTDNYASKSALKPSSLP